MNTLIIDRKNTRLSQSRGVLKIETDGDKPRSIPISRIQRVVVTSDVQLQSRLLGVFASQGISMAVLNPRKPEEYGVLVGNGRADVRRRLGQYRASENDAFCVKFARIVVTSKLQGQRNLLRKKLLARPEHRKALHDSLATISHCIDRLQNEPMDLKSIRGIEGAGAAAYFRAYAELLPASMQFSSRNRRPPRDPVNALLSLSYTLLNSLAVYLLQLRGYESLVGFYHGLSYSRASLSSDIIEPVRPLLDGWVLNLVNSQTLTAGHFRTHKGGCLLDKSGRRIYYQQWETTMKKEVLGEINRVILSMMALLGDRDDDTHG
jgi:CRISPR-associated protein Cas1